jgi:hypothetical protein
LEWDKADKTAVGGLKKVEPGIKPEGLAVGIVAAAFTPRREGSTEK